WRQRPAAEPGNHLRLAGRRRFQPRCAGRRQLMADVTKRRRRRTPGSATRALGSGSPVGTVAALAAATGLLAGCGVSLQSMPKPGADTDDTYRVQATFDNVLNLPDNAEIRDGSREVGVVGDMRVTDYKATVDLRIKDSYDIPAGSTARVRFDNPLGDLYVEIEQPADDDTAGGGYLEPGDTLPASDTSSAPTVQDTLGALATVLNGGGVGDIQTIAHELNEVFDGNQSEIRDLIGKLDTAATDLAGGIDHIDDALEALDDLATELNAQGDALPKGLKSLSRAIDVLAGQNNQINQLLDGLAEFGDVGNEVIATSGEETVRALQKIVPVVRQIVQADDQITPALQNLQALQAQVPEVTKGGYAELSVTLHVLVDSAPSGSGSTTRACQAAAAPVGSLLTPLGPLTADDDATGIA